MSLPPSASGPKPSVRAALLLLVRELFPQLGPWPGNVATIVALTGTSRSQAYAMLGRLKVAIDSLLKEPGRPAMQVAQSGLASLAIAVRDFVFAHPGCVRNHRSRSSYSDGFRHFIAELWAAQDGELGLAPFSQAAGVPVGTLQDWLGEAAQGAGYPRTGTEDQPWGGLLHSGGTNPLAALPQPDEDGLQAHGTGTDKSAPTMTEPPPAPLPPAVSTDPQVPCPDSSPSPKHFPRPIKKRRLRSPRRHARKAAQPPPAKPRPTLTITHPVLRAIVEGWQSWHGSISHFANHLRDDLGYRVGRTYVASVLHALGLHRHVRRGRVDTPWSRDSFIRFFPGAQLLGDGTIICVEVGDERFAFNLQLTVDVASGATTGLIVSDVEDQATVLDTFLSSLVTTGAPPIAMLLDGKPCNHTAAVEAAIAPTLLIRATPGRGQAKASVEGAFGLFVQAAPPLRVRTSSSRELARDIAVLVTTIWARATNGRPRKRLQDLSPADHYRQHTPTETEYKAVRQHLLAFRRQARLAAETRGRRVDPIRRRFVAESLASLGIDDPDGKVANALARFANEALVRGFAIYGAKKQQGTLPPGAIDHRYLGGIIRSHDARLELLAEAQLQLELRRRLGQLRWDALEATVQSLSRTTADHQRPHALLDLALDAQPELDFHFFARAAAQAVQALPPAQANEVLAALIRRVASAYRVPKTRRSDLLAVLTSAAVTSESAMA